MLYTWLLVRGVVQEKEEAWRKSEEERRLREEEEQKAEQEARSVTQYSL